MRPLCLLAIAIALALVGCNTRERVAARHDEQCRSYGFQPGTENYGKCRLTLDVERNRSSGDDGGLSARGLQMMRTGRMTPSVTCTPLPGGATRCE